MRGLREECLDQIIVLSAERITGKMDAKCRAEEGEHVISENTEGGRRKTTSWASARCHVDAVKVDSGVRS